LTLQNATDSQSNKDSDGSPVNSMYCASKSAKTGLLSNGNCGLPVQIRNKEAHMKKGFLLGLILFCLSAGGAFAQEFTTTPKVRPQPIPPRPAIEEGSDSSIVHKWFTAPKKYQLLNPGAPASYGSGQQVILGNPLNAINNKPERANVWKLFSFTF
jgi:hypothetical protein